jgi:hypothetical protein
MVALQGRSETVSLVPGGKTIGKHGVLLDSPVTSTTFYLQTLHRRAALINN